MLNKKTETELKTECIKLLEKGKVGWDVPHTLLAVKKMRQLIKKEGGNETILIPTIYLHDTGYPYIEKNNNFQKMMESKKDHAEIAEKNAKIILKELNFSSAQIKTIGCLIKNHDKIDIITKTRNGQLVFEADSLAQIDLPSITPTSTKKETIKFLNYFKKHRLPKIKTKTGLTMIKTILKKAEKYIKNWN